MITSRDVVHGERSSNRVTKSMIRPTLAIYCGTMSCYLICTPLAFGASYAVNLTGRTVTTYFWRTSDYRSPDTLPGQSYERQHCPTTLVVARRTTGHAGR